MEMYSLRVSRAQKASWDAYATQLSCDTSLLVRTVMDAVCQMTPVEFAQWMTLEAQTDDAEG